MQTIESKYVYQSVFNLTVLITGLGYFIDSFDAFLFNVVRVASLTELGLAGDALTKAGIDILNSAILGTLIGGIFWGMLGDKIGRKKALLGSILTYSLATLANAFVHDVQSYTLVRFVVGFGIAGEVGLGVTLVGETIRQQSRTYALTLFTVLGLLGVAAAALSLEVMHWRTSYLVGGSLGLVLLFLRSMLFESSLFNKGLT